MRLWSREIAGWLLLGLSLYVFFRAIRLLADPEVHYILEGSAVVFVGFILFRGGIHLLKVAVAAQICLRADEDLKGQRPGATPTRSNDASSARALFSRRPS